MKLSALENIANYVILSLRRESVKIDWAALCTMQNRQLWPTNDAWTPTLLSFFSWIWVRRLKTPCRILQFALAVQPHHRATTKMRMAILGGPSNVGRVNEKKTITLYVKFFLRRFPLCGIVSKPWYLSLALTVLPNLLDLSPIVEISFDSQHSTSMQFKCHSKNGTNRLFSSLPCVSFSWFCPALIVVVSQLPIRQIPFAIEIHCLLLSSSAVCI